MRGEIERKLRALIAQPPTLDEVTEPSCFAPRALLSEAADRIAGLENSKLNTPDPIEGAALYAGGAYLLGRDVLCIGFVYHLLPVLVLGGALTLYCVYRVFWCLHKQVTE